LVLRSQWWVVTGFYISISFLLTFSFSFTTTAVASYVTGQATYVVTGEEGGGGGEENVMLMGASLCK
jgi:hypothetical protein